MCTTVCRATIASARHHWTEHARERERESTNACGESHRLGLDVGAGGVVEHVLRLAVRVRSNRVDHALAEVGVDNLGFWSHLEDHAEGEAVLVPNEGAEFLRQHLGEHVKAAVHEVRRGAAVGGLLVKRRVRRHEVRHVGDVNAHLPEPRPRQVAPVQRVVDVAAPRRVNAHHRQVPQVPPQRP